MAKKRRYVVRVVMFKNEHAMDRKPGNISFARNMGTFLECLRYAGLVTIHRDDEKHVTFDLHAPRNIDDEVWARQNAERMQTFGINAEKAPEWLTTDGGDRPA